MKIGIISINMYTSVLNFASPLHSYIFQEFLNQNNIENVIISYKPCYTGKLDTRHPYDYYLKHPIGNAAKQEREIEKWKDLYQEREVRYDRLNEFINKYYKKTKTVYTPELLDTTDPHCDIYICVTDVIWKYNPKNGFDPGFFLACKTMEGKGKIAYAASRGPSVFTPEQKNEFFQLIKPFDFISVREKSLQEYINESSDANAQLVLDPVFLQTREFYNKLAIAPAQKKYVLIYIVMERNPALVEAAVRFAQERNLSVIEIGENLEDRTIPQGTEHPLIYGMGIEEWLGYMRDADYIFTNSFHCACFSIIFEKQFFVGTRNGDKVLSVLALFNLSDRYLESSKCDLTSKIDFVPVQELLEKHRQSSANFLLQSIKKTEKRIFIRKVKAKLRRMRLEYRKKHTPKGI